MNNDLAAVIADAEASAESLGKAARSSTAMQKFVLAESCSGGMAAALVTRVPGASEIFCGSAVTYRQNTKHEWLAIDRETIAACSTESQEVTSEMAVGVLRNTPEANWSAAITGHLGPDAPSEKDGVIFVSVATRKPLGVSLVSETVLILRSKERMARQIESAGLLLAQLKAEMTRTH